MKLTSFLAAAAIALAGTANAATVVSVDFTKNHDFIGTFVNPVTGNGVVGNQGTGIAFDIASTGNDIWTSHGGAPGTVGASGTQTLNVATSLEGVDKVHSLMNLWWGSTTPGLTSVSFEAANGFVQTFALTGGVELRDYNRTASFPNSVSSPMTSTWWLRPDGARRLDMVTFDLDDAFLSSALVGITFTDEGARNTHRAFVAGISAELISTVPVPASLPLLLSGIAGATILRRRRN